MKKPKIVRLRFLAVLWPGKQRRGVAIITVLAIVSLMTVLIVSFFQMAQTAKTTAIGSVEMERVVSLKDVITNYVTAQIRQATTLPGGGGTQTLWISQPGAIRTFHGSAVNLNRVYKLYSAEKMMIDGVPKDSSPALVNEIERDLDSQWDQYPDMWVDLNRPVRPSSSEREASNPAKILSRLIYPIADPSRYNGQENDKDRNTEGFVYGERRLSSKTMNGVDAKKGQLAMPVRWIYLLRDGTTGTVDKEGNFNPMQKDGGEPTRENPIVSRIAWWVDDESCKINVNTASIPVPWDTPRTSSKEDLWYAQFQPISGEVQHYPGHPAQTDLCAVFFPGRRYTPDSQIFPIGKMQRLEQRDANMVWSITPFVTEKGGTQGGTVKVSPLSAQPVPLDNDDHLLATFEELYFKARGVTNNNLDDKRGSAERDDSGRALLTRIEGSQFFLTTRSNSPEITVFGTPRVCMFPMNDKVVAEVGKASGSVIPTVGAFEVTMATNATIGAKLGLQGKAFYFQRATNSDSRHNAFYNNDAGRNVQMLMYLKKLSISIPPGYPELTPAFSTFFQKYERPAGPAGDNTDTKVFDSSDRTQILLSMLDMLRSSNMSPGYLQSGNSYDGGLGQVSGICGCQPRNSDPQGPHTKALVIANPGKQPWITPKGTGRTYGPAEICFFGIVPAVKKGSVVTGTPPAIANPTMQTKWANAKTASLIQVGVLINAFCPRQGWAPMFGQAGLNLSTHRATSASDPRSPRDGTTPAPFVMANAGSDAESTFYIGNLTDGSSRDPGAGNFPPGLIPWAGLAGPRVMSTQLIATFDPFVYEGPDAGSTNVLNVQLKWKPNEILRIFIYEGPPNAANTNQGIEVSLDSEILNLRADFYQPGIQGIITAAATAAPGAFPPPQVTFTSLVVPHGDYRLTATPLRVERGQFLPHRESLHALEEPILNGSSSSYVPLQGASLGMAQDQLLTDGKTLPAMDPRWAPHFPPVQPDLLCRKELGAEPMPKVLDVASSNPLRARRFANGRRDGEYSVPVFNPWAASNASQNPSFPNGNNKIPNRGSSDPIETGDFDNGVGLCPDGPYMNQPDDGDVRDANMPYYLRLRDASVARPATFSPNRVLRSAVDFGSIPTGIQARVPWQTLRFRPDPGMYDPNMQIKEVSNQPKKPSGYQHYFPFSNYCGPKDHLFLDMWWVPIVEPWSISEGFATKGQINLNQQIFPFTYIERTTALHALLRSERMMAIPDNAGDRYKNSGTFPSSDTYRHWINAKETLRQLTEFRWKGQDAEGNTMAFNAFRSASEICELWLVPEEDGTDNTGGNWTLDYIIKEFWEKHRLTGDNMRERPYSNLYPRCTVRSNVYRVHMVAQTLKQASTNKPESFKTAVDSGADPDLVTAEWRGSALVERVLNPNEPTLQTFDYAPGLNDVIVDTIAPVWTKRLDNYYTYRVTEVKQFTE